ncbi:hypothetical protein K458DRAFT_84895 [Lentithecium fluviatile CBS 122367]|uniref:Uncharacterized protein n=1 Tax=Lentithecium fluviatile CBS 122367 TaxID=1168545 RepID=A0A6G1ISS1_9PLEO|nr:hypothetical protein K458DRAFT_84895 [Lentithecium fluviatile CBS 122367]
MTPCLYMPMIQNILQFTAESCSPSTPTQTMIDPAPSLSRIAYIRTVTRTNTKTPKVQSFLSAYVWQSRQGELAKGVPRHRVLFGDRNSFDASMLDILIARIQSSVPADVKPPIKEYEFPWPSFQHMTRSDWNCRISEEHASMIAGEEVRRRRHRRCGQWRRRQRMRRSSAARVRLSRRFLHHRPLQHFPHLFSKLYLTRLPRRPRAQE